MNKNILVEMIIISLLILPACTSTKIATPTTDISASGIDLTLIVHQTASSEVHVTEQALVKSIADAGTVVAGEIQAVHSILDQTATARQEKTATLAAIEANRQATTTAYQAEFGPTITAKFAEIEATAAARDGPTRTPKFAATRIPQDTGFGLINEHTAMLLDLGYLDANYETSSKWFALSEFEENLAQRDWYKLWPILTVSEWLTPYVQSDLQSEAEWVLFGDISWEMDDKNADHSNSGCGVAFAFQDEQNFKLIHLRLDGNAILGQLKDDNWIELESNNFGKPGLPAGVANIALLNAGKRIVLLVDGRKVIDTVQNFQDAGVIAWTVHSGTNKGEGMRCKVREPWLMFLNY